MLIGFEWQRDQKGYRIIEARAPRPKRPNETLLTADAGRPARIVRLGGKLEPSRPLDSAPDLYRVFSRYVRDARTALEFVQSHGPLTRRGLDPEEGDDVPHVIKHAQMMDALMAAAAKQDGKSLAQKIGPGGMRLPMIDAALVVEPFSKRLRLSLGPRSLLDALWLQCATRLAGGAIIRECAHCGVWFEAGGAGPSRRRDSRFCSDEHRVTYNSLKRSRKIGPEQPRAGDGANEREHHE